MPPYKYFAEKISFRQKKFIVNKCHFKIKTNTTEKRQLILVRIMNIQKLNETIYNPKKRDKIRNFAVTLNFYCTKA